MKRTRMLIAVTLLAMSGPVALAADKTEQNEARLAKMLEGRTAGEPVSCIGPYRGNRLEVIEGVAMVYDAGDVLYVARPTDPKAIGRDDIIVVDRFGGQICHTDVIRTVDRMGGYFTGVVFLEKFVPYRKQN